MPKVITGTGLQEFIETGKHETITAQKKEAPKEAPALEVKKEAPAIEIKAEEPKTEAKEAPKEDDGLEPEDKDLSEIIRKKIGKKHRAMKEAQEAAADAETFAKGQYDRARLAEERASQLERELTEAKKAQQMQKPTVPEEQEPNETDPKYIENGQFNWKKFTKDQSEFAARKAVAEDRARQERERFEAREAQVNARYGEQLRAAHEKYPDLDRILQERKDTLILPQGVLDYMKRSSHGGELTYYFATHPEDAARLSQMAVEDDSPVRAIAEVGEIVGKLKETTGKTETAKAATPVPLVPDRGGAPPPITPISGSGTGTINTDPSKMPYKELRAYERERERAKRRH